MPYSAVTKVIMGDTDRTPDGGTGAGFLGAGATNLKKVAAYTTRRCSGSLRRSSVCPSGTSPSLTASSRAAAGP